MSDRSHHAESRKEVYLTRFPIAAKAVAVGARQDHSRPSPPTSEVRTGWHGHVLVAIEGPVSAHAEEVTGRVVRGEGVEHLPRREAHPRFVNPSTSWPDHPLFDVRGHVL